MLSRILGVALACAFTLSGAPKSPVVVRGSNASVDLEATLYLGKEAVKQVLGSDLEGYYIVLGVKVTPRGSDPLAVRHDDFVLRTDKNGERTTPFAPSQIAGKGVLVLSEEGGSQGVMAENAGPVWGGYPAGRPGRLGGDGGAIGNSSSGTTQATIHSGGKDKEDPLMQVLKEKILPEKKTAEPVSGLLYFPLEAKQKQKDLELIYTTPSGKISLRFK
ncbi:MAG: hypothetical protein IT158_03330 [Bryobacterales bacterium]|nr:hypothetical protein [Bryobacterales bacterium]